MHREEFLLAPKNNEFKVTHLKLLLALVWGSQSRFTICTQCWLQQESKIEDENASSVYVDQFALVRKSVYYFLTTITCPRHLPKGFPHGPFFSHNQDMYPGVASTSSNWDIHHILNDILESKPINKRSDQVIM